MTNELVLPGRKRKTMDWKKHIIPKAIYKLEHEYTFAPTIRGMFYNLVSDGVISNTNEHYKGLDRALVDARNAGLISMDAFVDNTRKIVDISNDVYWTPQSVINYHEDRLKQLPTEYFTFANIPRWHKQSHYVEVWLEKDAVTGTFRSILKDSEVRIVPNRGWSSLSFKNENIQRLLKKQQEGKIVHVLYFGDFDPSGSAMDRNLARGLSDALGMEHVFERIALTKAQIKKFGLEHLKNPDPDVLMKLERDPNSYSFIKENEDLYQIEIDALQNDPERFKRLVLSAVCKYFDQCIYKSVMAEFTPKQIDELVRESVQFSDVHYDDDSEDANNDLDSEKQDETGA
jgi:hypothetical protein